MVDSSGIEAATLENGRRPSGEPAARAGDAEHPRSGRPLALFVSAMVPWNLGRDGQGGVQRMFRMLEGAIAAWPNVAVLFISVGARARGDDVPRLVEWMQARLGTRVPVRVVQVALHRPILSRLPDRVAAYFRPGPNHPTLDEPSLAAIRRAVAEFEPGDILVHRLGTFRMLRLAGALGDARVSMDMDDIEHLAHARSVFGPPRYTTKFLLGVYIFPLLVEAYRALARCDRVFVCSTDDARKLRRMRPGSGAVSIPNSLADPAGGGRPIERKPIPGRVLLVAFFPYVPNTTGLNWFLEHVWGGVVDKVPGARLRLVGEGGDRIAIPARLRHSVDVLGFVDSLSPEYVSASVVICPLLSGGGTRIKLIEGAAYSSPMVSTGIGAEGLALQDGRSILIRDDADAFGAAVVDLLSGAVDGDALGAEARRLYSQHYERESVRALLAAALQGKARACSGTR